MTPRPLPLVLPMICVLLTAATIAVADPGISASELRRHIDVLAGEDLAGRRPLSEGSRRAGDYLVQQMTHFGLVPKGESDTPFQEVRNGDGVVIGCNVCFALPGQEGATAAEVVVIGAHYDHLGESPDGTFRGADDNASGVAALLEMAEAMSAQKVRPARTILFLAFDNEEEGLRGSEYWVKHPTVPLASVVAMINIDMLGRSMMDRFPGSVFAFGTEWSRDLGDLLQDVRRPDGVEIWNISTLFVGPRSDFLWFALHGIPYVFFTTGTHADYHTPRDVPERLDYDSFERLTRMISTFATRIADDTSRPHMNCPQPNGLREAEVCQKIVREMRERPLPGMEDWQRAILEYVDRRTTRMVERRRVSLLDRAMMIVGTQLLTLTMVESNRTSPSAGDSKPATPAQPRKPARRGEPD